MLKEARFFFSGCCKPILCTHLKGTRDNSKILTLYINLRLASPPPGRLLHGPCWCSLPSLTDSVEFSPWLSCCRSLPPAFPCSLPHTAPRHSIIPRHIPQGRVRLRLGSSNCLRVKGGRRERRKVRGGRVMEKKVRERARECVCERERELWMKE